MIVAEQFKHKETHKHADAHMYIQRTFSEVSGDDQ